MEDVEEGNSYARGYQARIPDTPQGAGTPEVVTTCSERVSVHGDG